MNSQTQKLFVDDLHKRYGDNEVLKGVSLKANSGDVISVIGSSGSGKSTMLRCINFLEQPNAGRIVVDGEEVRTTKDKTGALRAADPKQLQRVRTKLSMVFQHFNLWSHMNVIENVMEAPVNVLGIPKKEAEDLTEASPLLAARGVQRTRTIGSVLNNLLTWIIVAIAFVLILDTLDFDATTLIASAGVLAA